MKLSRLFAGFCILFLTIFMGTSVLAAEDDTTTVITAQDVNNGLTYEAHVAYVGWQNPVKADEIAGTTGEAKAVEAIKIDTEVGTVTYNTYVQDQGWGTPVTNGQVSGTTGQTKRIEAIQITLEDCPDVDLYYRVHSANFGWLGWTKDGETAGTTGCSFAVEAFQIVAVPKGSAAPGDTANPSIDKSDITMSLRTHVSNLGWTEPVKRGVSGTTGQSKAVEAIELVVTDPTGQSGAVGNAYIQNIGWQGAQDANTMIGTTGQGLRIEAFEYRLTGPAASIYDINYRAHVSNLGWMGWTINNKPAGTSDAAIPVEAVDILLEDKGTGAETGTPYKYVQTPLGIIPPAANCIVINISTQRMAYYDNYDVIINTNVVTGMYGIDNTKVGDWKVEEKLSPYRTKGPGYDAVVRYWLTLYRGEIYGFDGAGPIIDRVGIHDADWRTDWRSNAYLTNGSHGCVNTPLEPMTYIFNHATVGIPVRIR